MKLAKRLILLVVLLIIVGVVIAYLNLNRILRTTVETQATQSLNLKTTLGAADLSLFGGELKLKDLGVASPAGYSAPQMFALGGSDVKVSYGQLRQQPIHINAITLSKPVLVIEQAGGKLNFQAAMDQMPKSAEPAPSEPASKSEPIKLIIDDLSLENATVIMRPGDISSIPGLSAVSSALPKEINIPLPTVTLKNIGSGDGNQNGAAIKDVVMQVVTAMADAASKSGAMPEQLKGLLNLNLASVKAQLGAEFQKQLGGLTSQLPGGVGNLAKDPGALVKDPSKALQGVGDAIGGKSSSSSTQPSAEKSVEQGLGGLLGGKKKKD